MVDISLDAATIITPEATQIEFERVGSIRSIASVRKEGTS